MRIALTWMLWSCLLGALPAQAVIISFHDFFIGQGVTVSADGSTANLVEDPSLGTILLDNDPGLGDPFIIDPSLGSRLEIHFSFTQAAGNDDQLGIFLRDGSGAVVDEFLADDTSSGLVSFDLTPYPALVLGLSIQLNAFDLLADSVVVVSDPRIVPLEVSEPRSLALLAAVLVLLIGRQRRHRQTG